MLMYNIGSWYMHVLNEWWVCFLWGWLNDVTKYFIACLRCEVGCSRLISTQSSPHKDLEFDPFFLPLCHPQKKSIDFPHFTRDHHFSLGNRWCALSQRILIYFFPIVVYHVSSNPFHKETRRWKLNTDTFVRSLVIIRLYVDAKIDWSLYILSMRFADYI